MTSFQKILVRDWPTLLLLGLPFILLALFWNQIPESVPVHWNINGEPDRWAEKGWEIFFTPVLNVAIYLLLLALPYIDPKRRTESGQKSLRAIRFLVPFLMTGVFLITLMQWLGIEFLIGKSLGLVIVIFFMGMGNYLQSLQPNYFIGIRTPWTLESETNWRKTHRLGGRLWVLLGFALIITWFFVTEQTFLIALVASIIVMSLTPLIYSFYLYMNNRKQEHLG